MLGWDESNQEKEKGEKPSEDIEHCIDVKSSDAETMLNRPTKLKRAAGVVIEQFCLLTIHMSSMGNLAIRS